MFRALIVVALMGLPAAARAQSAAPVSNDCSFTADIPARSEKSERPGAIRYIAAGNVVITCGTEAKVYADEAEYDSDSDLITLRGNVVLEKAGLNVYAEHAVFNQKTQTGTFYEVHGTAQTSMNTLDKDQFGGMEPDIAFWARELSKTGPESFEIKDGAFTSCVQATPRWSIAGTSGGFVKDKRVTFVNAVLRVKDVPVFYIPYIYYPINKEDRSTGFLMPSFGSSGAGGFTLSNAFFWAINRSSDATFFYDYFKKSGNGFGTEYRFVTAPGSNGDFRIYTLGQTVEPATGGAPAQTNRRSYRFTAHLNQDLPRGFRLVGSTNYFTNVTTQHVFNQNSFAFSDQTRDLVVGLTGGRRRYRFSSSYEQHDLYSFNNNVATASRFGYAPRVGLLMSDAPIGRSRAYFGANADSAYLSKIANLDDPATNQSLWRFDAKPHVQMPLSRLSFLTITTSAAWEITHWLESLDPLSGAQVSTPLTRQLFNADVRIVGPVFSRVWQPQAKNIDRVKHVIEPTLGVQWNSPFARQNEIVPIEGVDFTVGGTTTVNYGLTNRFLVRRRGTGTAPGPVRELLALDITQSYYTKAQASQADFNYPPCATGSFSAVRVALTARPADKLSGQFNTDINPEFRTPCTLGATGTFNTRPVQISAGWTKRQYIPGLRDFDNPNFADHFLNSTMTFSRANGHLGGSYTAQYDIRRNTFVQQRILGFYNSQCCGLSVDYQIRDISYLGTPNRRIHQFNFSFTLAGIGSFANPLGSFGGK
jgi:LPS-assembly protein